MSTILLTNVIVGAVVVTALVITQNPLVLVGLYLLQQEQNIQIDPSQLVGEEAQESEYSNGDVGFHVKM